MSVVLTSILGILVMLLLLIGLGPRSDYDFWYRVLARQPIERNEVRHEIWKWGIIVAGIVATEAMIICFPAFFLSRPGNSVEIVAVLVVGLVDELWR